MATGRPDYTSQALMRGSQSGTHRTVAVDQAGNMLTLMKGQYGGDPVTIAVDAQGKLYGVLQGLYGGSLQTLAVDSQGRMLAVLTDPEDVFGNPQYMGAAELAARLGAPNRITRSGQVLYYDRGGSNVHQYFITETDAANTIVEDSGLESSGVAPLFPLCYLMTVGAEENDYVEMSKYLPYIANSGGVGIEVVATLRQNLKYFDVRMQVYDGTQYFDAGMRVNGDASHLYLWGDAASWHDLGSIGTIDDMIPLSMKFVFKPSTQYYTKMLTNVTDWTDAATHKCVKSAVASQGKIYFQIRATCNDGGGSWARVGPIVVTVNEV